MAMIVAVLAVVSAAGRVPALGAGQGPAGEERHPLIGLWEVVVSYEGQSGIEVTNLSTFGADGTLLVASTAQLPTIPGVFGTGLVLTEGHEAWIATGERTTETTYRYLTLDQSGSISSTNTMRLAVEVAPGGDAYRGEFRLEMVSPAGNSMGSGQGTFQGEQIQVEPLASPVATPTA